MLSILGSICEICVCQWQCGTGSFVFLFVGQNYMEKKNMQDYNFSCALYMHETWSLTLTFILQRAGPGAAL